MTRQDYAKMKNWKGTATRMIAINELPKYEVGEIINPGLCWTDGGQFTIENSAKYEVLFKIIENVEGHAVDYSNEEECYDLGCEDCWAEKEILIDENFEVVNFYAWDEETEYAEVHLKPIK